MTSDDERALRAALGQSAKAPDEAFVRRANAAIDAEALLGRMRRRHRAASLLQLTLVLALTGAAGAIGLTGARIGLDAVSTGALLGALWLALSISCAGRKIG